MFFKEGNDEFSQCFSVSHTEFCPFFPGFQIHVSVANQSVTVSQYSGISQGSANFEGAIPLEFLFIVQGKGKGAVSIDEAGKPIRVSFCFCFYGLHVSHLVSDALSGGAGGLPSCAGRFYFFVYPAGDLSPCRSERWEPLKGVSRPFGGFPASSEIYCTSCYQLGTTSTSGLIVHPVPAPTSTNAELKRRSSEGGRSQKLMLFNRGNAINSIILQ